MSVATKLEGGESLALDELCALEICQGISRATLAKLVGTVVVRHYAAGETICREGDYGSTAFYILDGVVTVRLQSPMAHVASDRPITGLFRRIRTALVREATAEHRRTISVDAPVAITTEHPLAELGAGSLFGEMTCLSRYPRSATVVASEPCVVLEMLEPVLRVLRKNPTFRAMLEHDYRERALAAHLASVPLLAGIGPDALARLRDEVELIAFEPGETICHEGDPADAFYLVRIGFVRVLKSMPGGQIVLAYLPPGGAFGELGLLGEGRREATCSALDGVELVRIDSAMFSALLDEFPEFRHRISQVAQTRRNANRERESAPSTARLEEYLDHGLMSAQSLLVIDLERCTRCDDCVRACAATHDGVTRLVREGVRLDHFLVATSCRQCLDPACMIGCPVGAIRRRESLEVVIEDWCIGCGLCAKQCPYGNINLHPVPATSAAGSEAHVRNKATTCDLCNQLSVPACVAACSHDAAERVVPAEFFKAYIQS